jgi:hypothetical protein
MPNHRNGPTSGQAESAADQAPGHRQQLSRPVLPPRGEQHRACNGALLPSQLVAGFSINTVSLLGLVLAIGLVVDDAIVVVENVKRQIDDGKSPLDAAKSAMNEVTGPIIATTAVLMAVFVPVAFLPGITGQLYLQFALTIAISVALSAFTRAPSARPCALCCSNPEAASRPGPSASSTPGSAGWGTASPPACGRHRATGR